MKKQLKDLILLTMVLTGIFSLKVADGFYSEINGKTLPVIVLEPSIPKLKTKIEISPKVYTIKDLNSMDAVELEQLNGIGPAIAKEIILYREQNNGFKTLNELKKVKGIGEKKYDSLMKQFQ